MTKKKDFVKDDTKLMFGFKPKNAKKVDIEKTEQKKTEAKKKVKRK